MQEARATLFCDGQRWLFLTGCVTLEKSLSLFGCLLRKNKKLSFSGLPNSFLQLSQPREHVCKSQCQVQTLIPSETHWPGCWGQLWACGECISMGNVVEAHLPASHEETTEHSHICCWPSDEHSRCNHYSTLRLCLQADGRTRGLLSSRCLLVNIIISNSGKCNNC